MLTRCCHVCGERRPDHLISVLVTDRSEELGFPLGTLKHHVRYCNDRPSCVLGAENVNFLTSRKVEGVSTEERKYSFILSLAVVVCVLLVLAWLVCTCSMLDLLWWRWW